jgi:hypothetical protein
MEEVKRWRTSGQPAQAYARARGLNAGTLMVWASRLRHELGAQTTAKTGKVSSLFLPVEVSSKSKKCKADSDQTIDGEFEVVLTNGRRIRFAGACPTHTLGRLLDLVERGASC